MSNQTEQKAFHWMVVGYVSAKAAAWIKRKGGQVRDLESSPPLVAVALAYDPAGVWRWSHGEQEHHVGVEVWNNGYIEEASTGLILQYGARTGVLPEYASVVDTYLVMPDEDVDAEMREALKRGQERAWQNQGESRKGAIPITHVALVSMDGQIDACPATSYEEALNLLRRRAETWDWEIDSEHPLDRGHASLEQLSALYALDAICEGDCWVAIAEVWPKGVSDSVQPSRSERAPATELEERDSSPAAQIDAGMPDPTSGEGEDLRPEASQAMRDVLRPIRVAQVRTYLEKTGWQLWANHFKRGEGWTLHPELASPRSWVYIKPDPEAPDQKDQPFVVEVPGSEEQRDYLSRLQSALERIAGVEQTTFVTVICRILGIKQVVLHPIEEEAAQKGSL